ncbi:MAG: LysR family transcriptional regulator, partial [Alicyclobacillus sp.]|nr:LysR family transcriptional regulator [Alicyclobacillus sp.]
MNGPLNLHQLYLFCTVAEHHSFSSAARSLMMTQPAVSLQIKALERTLNTVLFERNGQKLQLTDAGQMVYEAAKTMMSLEHNLRTAVSEWNSGRTGHITVATNRPFGRYVLPTFLTTYLRAYPQLDVAVQYETTERICRSVLEGVADVGVVSSTGQMKHPRLQISLLYRDEWCLVAAAHSPW